MRLYDFGMTAIILTIAISAFIGYGGSAVIDKWTGTTIEERCAARQARLAVLETIENPTPEEQEAIALHRAFVETACIGAS